MHIFVAISLIKLSQVDCFVAGSMDVAIFTSLRKNMREFKSLELKTTKHVFVAISLKQFAQGDCFVAGKFFLIPNSVRLLAKT